MHSSRPFPGISPGKHLFSLATWLASTLPLPLPSFAVTRVLQHIFARALAEGEFDFLENRCLKLSVEDFGLNCYFSCRNQRLLVNERTDADAVIRGDLSVFLLLASGHEDPDTLFFQRKLKIEGDTELGLEMKNLLDAFDPAQLPAPLIWGIQKMLKIAG